MSEYQLGDVLWLQKIGAINRETARNLLRLKHSRKKSLQNLFNNHMNDIEKRINMDGLSIFNKEKTIAK